MSERKKRIIGHRTRVLLNHLRTLHEAKRILPIENSIVTYESILVIMLYHYFNKELTDKILLLSQEFNEVGTKYNFEKLKRNGWIEFSSSDKDSSCRVVFPTEKLINRFEEFLDRQVINFDKVDELN